MKTILVTGAGGFVASHLVPHLADSECSVIAVSRDAARSFNHRSVTTALAPDSAASWAKLLVGVDAIVHLAGLAHRVASAEEHDQANRLSTAQLAEEAARAGVGHFVFVSSIAAQVGPSSTEVLTEMDEPHPAGAYGISKLAAEKAVAASGVPFTILRPVVINGPGAKGNAGLLQRLAGLPFPMPVGGLSNKRSMLSIANFNSAIDTVLFNPKAIGETFIVADPKAMTVAQIIAAVRQEAGRPTMVFKVYPALLKLALLMVGKGALWERLGRPLVADPAKLLSIGWKPQG